MLFRYLFPVYILEYEKFEQKSSTTRHTFFGKFQTERNSLDGDIFSLNINRGVQK